MNSKILCLQEVKKEIELIRNRRKVMEDKRKRLFEFAKKPSTVTRLNLLKTAKKYTIWYLILTVNLI